MAETAAYLDLITGQHRDKPNFVATVRALVEPLAALQAALAAMPAAFDLDEAVGVQLDRVGERVGRTRYVATPLAVYFTLDDAALGFDLGAWKGPYDPDTGLTALPDDAYRSLLRAKVAANQWDGTVPGAYDAWEVVFAPEGSLIVIEDHQDMSMAVGIAGRPPNAVLLALLTGGYIPLKPEGVRVSYYAITTTAAPLFGFDAQSSALAGFDTGAWASIVQPAA